jgi:nucleotide-binding universal stress UspA family protein
MKQIVKHCMRETFVHKAGHRKILIPVDGSDTSIRAMRHAVLLAKGLGASVFAYYVFHLPRSAGIAMTKPMKETSEKEIVGILNSAKNIALKSGVPCKQQAQGGGNSGKRIVNFAEKYNFDMIVMGSRGMGSAKEVFLGSTSNHVLHKSKMPVMIVK